MPGSKIDGQHDGNRERRRDAREPGHQHPEPAVRAFVGKQAGAVADHLEERNHGIAGSSAAWTAPSGMGT